MGLSQPSMLLSSAEWGLSQVGCPCHGQLGPQPAAPHVTWPSASWFPSPVTRDTSTFSPGSTLWSGRASQHGVGEHPAQQVRDLIPCCKIWIPMLLFLGCVLAAAAAVGSYRHLRNQVYEAVVWGRPQGTTSSFPLIPSREIERQV